MQRVCVRVCVCDVLVNSVCVKHILSVLNCVHMQDTV